MGPSKHTGGCRFSHQGQMYAAEWVRGMGEGLGKCPLALGVLAFKSIRRLQQTAVEKSYCVFHLAEVVDLIAGQGRRGRRLGPG